MNRIFCIFSMLLTTTVFGGVKAQELHFIYLQSEQKQAFYIRSEGKVYSSSDAGFVILPQLKEGTFSFTLGFPKNKWAAQNYQLEITNRDIGFQLKKVDDANWALYDMQSNELLSALTQPASNAPYVTLINDEFTNVLADVSNTPSIKEKKWEAPPVEKAIVASTVAPVVMDAANQSSKSVADTLSIASVVAQPKEPIQPDTIQPSTATAINDNPPANIDSVIALPATETIAGVEKIYDQKSDSGRVMKFKVQGVEGFEEVTVLLPNEAQTTQASKPAVIFAEPVTNEVVPIVEKNEAPIIATITDTTKREQMMTVATIQLEPSIDTVAIKVVTPDTLAIIDATVVKEEKKCETAEEKDLIILRRKMVVEDSEEKMLEVALDNMKTKCFNTEQTGHLATLFLEEEKRCVFLEKAFKNCSNKADYGKLRYLLTSAQYLDRFNQLLL